MTFSVCTFKWRPHYHYRTRFDPDTVNVLAAMVARWYARPHRFICFTDDGDGIDRTRVEVRKLWSEFASVRSPAGAHRPSCYRRLKLFDPRMAAQVGPRVVWLDLDCVVTGDLAPLWDRPEDLVMWGGTNQKTPYNGSMCLTTIGARPQVYQKFNPYSSPMATRKAGFYGSDQAWISHVLGPDEARWSNADGVLSFARDVEPAGELPAHARVVFFHGRAAKPWDPDVAEKHEWIRQHYHV